MKTRPTLRKLRFCRRQKMVFLPSFWRFRKPASYCLRRRRWSFVSIRLTHDGWTAACASASEEPQRLQNLFVGLLPVPHCVQIRSPGSYCGASSTFFSVRALRSYSFVGLSALGTFGPVCFSFP